MSNAEPDFNDDIETMQEAVDGALNELTSVKAYTLKADELHDFKAAQYALRNLSEQHGYEDVEAVYESTDYGGR